MADSGEVNYKLNFQLGERTEVFRSCSVNFNGEMLIFGGNQLRQQVEDELQCTTSLLLCSVTPNISYEN